MLAHVQAQLHMPFNMYVHIRYVRIRIRTNSIAATLLIKMDNCMPSHVWTDITGHS